MRFVLQIGCGYGVHDCSLRFFGSPRGAGASLPGCSSSTATHTVAFFCPVKNGLEFASQAVVRGSSRVFGM